MGINCCACKAAMNPVLKARACAPHARPRARRTDNAIKNRWNSTLKRRAKGLSGHAAKRGRKRAAADVHAGAAAAPKATTAEVKEERARFAAEQPALAAPSLASSVRRVPPRVAKVSAELVRKASLPRWHGAALWAAGRACNLARAGCAGPAQLLASIGSLRSGCVCLHEFHGIKALCAHETVRPARASRDAEAEIARIAM